MFLAKLLGILVRDGALTLIDADGTTHRLGPARRAPGVVVRFHGRPHFAASLSAFLRGAYVDGALTLERGTVHDLCELCARSMARFGARSAAARAFVEGLELVPSARAGDFLPEVFPYDEILDADRACGAALFGDPGMTLVEAHEQKNQKLATKLLLRPGQSVLDIGSSWGALAHNLAETNGVDVTGLVASHEQAAIAWRRAREVGLANRVGFRVGDLREAGLLNDGAPFDRIVSAATLDHLVRGRSFSDFDRMREALADDGVAVVDCVARAERSTLPAGGVPAVGTLVGRAERAGLHVTDVEVLRYHAAETLRSWLARFTARRDLLVPAYGPRAYRGWEFDLARAEAAFRHGGLVVVQLQLAKRLDAVPLTRDYLHERVAWTRRSSGTPMPQGPSDDPWGTGGAGTRRSGGRKRRGPPSIRA
jgi:cyclopropane-fatty-acyl-phospholipid synthase